MIADDDGGNAYQVVRLQDGTALTLTSFPAFPSEVNIGGVRVTIDSADTLKTVADKVRAAVAARAES